MQADHLNLRHLRAFTAVCQNGSVTAASDVVHLSQPAITQAVAGLEVSFGVALFTRSHRGMFPTKAGDVLQSRCERALGLLHDATTSRRKGAQAHAYADSLTSTQLRALIGVASHGNYSVAARALGVSQPSLHRAARELEALAGQALFLKSPSGITLSPSAKALVRAARLAFAELRQAGDEITALEGAGIGELRLGSLPLSRGTLLPLALNRLTELHPGAQITVNDSPYSEMLHALRNGEIDLMLGALRDPPPAPDVTQEPVFTDKLGIYCRPDHALAGHVPDRATLARFPWVVARKGTPTRDHFDRYFKGTGTGPIIEANAMVLVRGLLVGSDKLAMISNTQAADDLASGALVRLPVDPGDAPRPIGLTTRSDWQPTPLQRTFREVLIKVAQSRTL